MTSSFLIWALFFPRLTLLFTYFLGHMPPNDTPLALDVAGACLAPRLLVGYWAYTNHAHPLWIALFVICGVGELFGGLSTAKRETSKSRKP